MTTKEYKKYLKREIRKCAIRSLATRDASEKAELLTQRGKLEARLLAISKLARPYGRIEHAMMR